MFKDSVSQDTWNHSNLQLKLAQEKSILHKHTFGFKDGLNKKDYFQRMQEFYDQNYSSNIMTLCLHSNHDVDDMEDMAESLFKSIPNKEIKIRNYNDAPFKLCYGEGELLGKFYEGVCPQMIKTVPASNVDDMKITWYMPYCG